ncbi:MAG: FHA domain-containing protein [Pirellula sp.]
MVVQSPLSALNRNLILSVQMGPWQGKRIAVPPGQTLTVGRLASAASVAFEADDFMSSVHFEVENQGSVAIARDLDSRNRTWVNNKIISSVELQEGDEIRAGKTLFSVGWERSLVEDTLQPTSDVFHKLDTSMSFEQFPVRPTTPEYTQPPTDYTESKPCDFMEQVSLGPSEGLLQKRDGDEGPLYPAEYAMGPYVETSQDRIAARVANHEKDPPSDIDFSQFDNYSADLDHSPVKSHENERRPGSRDRASINSSIYPPTKETFDAESIPNYFEPGSVHPSGVRRLNLYRSPRDYFPKFLDSLRSEGEFIVVSHFRKLGINVPDSMETISLFPNRPNASLYLPVGVSSDVWLGGFNQHWTSKLVECDGLVVVFGANCTSIVQRLNVAPLAGISPKDGFVGWYWPTQLQSMIDRVSENAISDWLGDDEIAIVYPNLGESIISSISKGTASAHLASLGFQQ